MAELKGNVKLKNKKPRKSGVEILEIDSANKRAYS